MGTVTRPPAVGRRHMVATSQPLATHAGLAALREGGTAADAAIAAAAVLCVCEPMSTGLGGDLFALVWDAGRVHGLDAAGPAALAAGLEPHRTGPRSVTLPGAVAGWAALSERHGRLGLDACMRWAIGVAEEGFAVAHFCARAWASAEERAPAHLRPAPRSGELVRMPELAADLRSIAAAGAAAFYTGHVAEGIAAVTDLTLDELAAYRPRWVDPLTAGYRGATVFELPPPTQGVAVLEALSILEHRGERSSTPELVRAMALALEDALARVRDGASVEDLLEEGAIEARSRQRPGPCLEPPGGTVYLCAVDEEGMAVSLVQSLFERFGSGVVVPGTGIVLQNRGACFSVGAQVVPGRRPYHTLIPGMIGRDGELLGPFGVTGGFLQAQAHVQFLKALLEDGCDPQQALDRPRFRLDGDELLIEGGGWDAGFAATVGRPVRRLDDPLEFGAGQAILRCDDGSLLGGSDSRKDGIALAD